MRDSIHAFMEQIRARNPGEPEFLQALRVVLGSIMPIVEATPAYKAEKILDYTVKENIAERFAKRLGADFAHSMMRSLGNVGVR